MTYRLTLSVPPHHISFAWNFKRNGYKRELKENGQMPNYNWPSTRQKTKRPDLGRSAALINGIMFCWSVFRRIYVRKICWAPLNQKKENIQDQRCNYKYNFYVMISLLLSALSFGVHKRKWNTNFLIGNMFFFPFFTCAHWIRCDVLLQEFFTKLEMACWNLSRLERKYG